MKFFNGDGVVGELAPELEPEVLLPAGFASGSGQDTPRNAGDARSSCPGGGDNGDLSP